MLTLASFLLAAHQPGFRQYWHKLTDRTFSGVYHANAFDLAMMIPYFIVLFILAAYGLAYLFYLGVCWISVLIGLSVSSPETVQGVSFIWTMPLTFGSSVLLARTATMPGWLQDWARVNPVTDLADSVRALTVGGSAGMHPLYTLAWAAGIVLVTFPLAMRMYARRVG